MTMIKMHNLAHTNPEEINMNNIQIGPKGLVKYSHQQYGKSHFLVLRLPVCQLDKYPIEYSHAFKTNDNKIPVNLKIPIGQEFTKTPFYVFIQNILDKYGDKTKNKYRYPEYNSEKASNYLKIKEMDLYSYLVTMIDNSDFKIKASNRKLSNLTELFSNFSPNIQVVPYVMLYYHKMSNGDFITLKPVKFYIGNNINMEQIDYIHKQQKYIITPRSDFYDCNQLGKNVSLGDFSKYIENQDNKEINTNNTKQIDITC